MIGRHRERELLADIIQETSSNLVAIYGRRRVGKTYLIREHFQNKFSFYHTGIANVSTEVQLDNFYKSILKYASKKCQYPQNWFDAFELLKQLLIQSKTKKKAKLIKRSKSQKTFEELIVLVAFQTIKKQKS